MKIRTHNKSQFGQKRLFQTGLVEFDNKGFAEVPKETAEYLIKNHKLITDEKGTVKEDVKEHDPIEGDYFQIKKKAEEYANMVAARDVTIKRLKSDLVALENTLEQYKALVNDLRKEIGILKEAKAVTEKEEQPVEDENEDVDLMKMTKEQMVDVCKEMGYPEKEWQNLNRSKLKSYVSKKLK